MQEQRPERPKEQALPGGGTDIHTSRGEAIPMSARVIEGFWASVNQRGEDECWPWRGVVQKKGYGTRTVAGPMVAGKRRVHTFTAHRLAYELTRGAIPEGLELDHLCHTADETCPGGDDCPHRRCVNPAHLEPVTCKENLHRSPLTRTAINAAKTRCIHGHPFDEENTYRRPSDGMRLCKACALKRQAERRNRERAAA